MGDGDDVALQLATALGRKEGALKREKRKKRRRRRTTHRHTAASTQPEGRPNGRKSLSIFIHSHTYNFESICT